MISGGVFDEARLKSRLEELGKTTAEEGFWDNPQAGAASMKEQQLLQVDLKTIERLDRMVDDLDTLLEFDAEGESVSGDFLEALGGFCGFLSDLELRILLSGEMDANSAILTIHPGAGGTESQDWAHMLYRMYTRWAERRGYQMEMLDYQEGETAGIKSVTILIKGAYAYGYLKTESGVHRLVRISPFDASARRHTSFSSVFVSPEVDNDIDIEVDDKEVRIDTFRSGGAGGQHVNKVSSAVRITHLPTGIAVSCQQERSQHKNRDLAWKILKSRLYQLEMEKRDEEKRALEKTKKDIAWGSQIRSYVLQPYRMVKDHRTEAEVGNADDVLDGNLDPFIKAALKAKLVP